MNLCFKGLCPFGNTLPNGNIWFNSSGNPSMAKAGSGDILTE